MDAINESELSRFFIDDRPRAAGCKTVVRLNSIPEGCSRAIHALVPNSLKKRPSLMLFGKSNGLHAPLKGHVRDGTISKLAFLA